MKRGSSNRIYWVDYLEGGDIVTRRFVAEGKLSKDEIKAKLYDHGGPSPDVVNIKKVRSQAVE